MLAERCWRLGGVGSWVVLCGGGVGRSGGGGYGVVWLRRSAADRLGVQI